MTGPFARRRWTPRAAVARSVELAREGGPRTLWFRLWGELLYRRLAVFELQLHGPLPEAPARIPLDFAPLTERDEGDLAVLGSSDPERTTDRLAAGHACYLARSEGRLVGACWVARGSLWSDYLGTRIPLAPGEALTYETYTPPATRGQGVGPALRAWVAKELAAEGGRRLLATVDPENAPAIRLVEKLGYRRIGTLGWVGAGPLRRPFCRMRGAALPPGRNILAT